MKRLASCIVLSSMLAVGAIFVACDGDDTTSTVTPGKDSGTDTSTTTDSGGGGDTGTGGVQQIGKVKSFGGASAPAIQNATVSIQGKSATTDSRGEYKIDVTAGQPFSMRVTAANYYSVLEQEWSIAATTDRGTTSMIDSATAGLLAASLPGFNPARGVLVIIVGKTGSCADVTGSVVNVTCGGGTTPCYIPPTPDGGTGDGGGEGGVAEGGAGDGGGEGGGGGDGGGLGLGPRHPFIAYFRGGQPSAQTTVDGNEPVAGIAYNLPLGSTVELKAAKPDQSCSMAAYPVTVPGENGTGAFTYTGKITMEAAQGSIVSAARVFLK